MSNCRSGKTALFSDMATTSILFCIIFALPILKATAQRTTFIDPCDQILSPSCTCGPNVINCTNVRDLSPDSLQPIATHFPRLTSLHLSGNKFRYMDKDTFHTQGSRSWSLTQLDLSKNAIVDIHERAFINLPKLQELNLSDNRISFRHRPVAPGHRVVRTGNFLLPMASSLQILDLSNAFDGQERRNSAHFSQNLTSLLFDPENGFRALEYLHLSKNDLAHLPADAFRGLPSLQYLDLSNNKLTKFQLSSGSGGQLMVLHLESNHIQVLDEAFMKMVDDSPTLQHVYLANNPFTCDCQAKGFIKWLKISSKIEDKESLFCAKSLPRHLINRSLMSLEEDQLRCSDGKSAVYTAGVFALCSVAAIGLISMLSCIVYANKRILFRAGTSFRNWLTMASSGGYEILESARPGSVKAEAV